MRAFDVPGVSELEYTCCDRNDSDVHLCDSLSFDDSVVNNLNFDGLLSQSDETAEDGVLYSNEGESERASEGMSQSDLCESVSSGGGGDSGGGTQEQFSFLQHK